jgi:hypothetical protein
MSDMKAWLVLSLAFLSPAVEASETAPAPAAAAAAQNTFTVHRCVDAKGLVTLQGESCPEGSHDSTREMTRPKDPPPGPPPPPIPDQLAVKPPVREEQQRELIPPPPLYRCTNLDGDERFTEQYDPNPRCEPIVLYFPYAGIRQPSNPQALSCRWVEDSCVRLSDWQACQRWRVKQKEAASAVMHAFSDTAAYRKSELQRINQIVNENCR